MSPPPLTLMVLGFLVFGLTGCYTQLATVDPYERAPEKVVVEEYVTEDGEDVKVNRYYYEDEYAYDDCYDCRTTTYTYRHYFNRFYADPYWSWGARFYDPFYYDAYYYDPFFYGGYYGSGLHISIGWGWPGSYYRPYYRPYVTYGGYYGGYYGGWYGGYPGYYYNRPYNVADYRGNVRRPNTMGRGLLAGSTGARGLDRSSGLRGSRGSLGTYDDNPSWNRGRTIVRTGNGVTTGGSLGKDGRTVRTTRGTYVRPSTERPTRTRAERSRSTTRSSTRGTVRSSSGSSSRSSGSVGRSTSRSSRSSGSVGRSSSRSSSRSSGSVGRSSSRSSSRSSGSVGRSSSRSSSSGSVGRSSSRSSSRSTGRSSSSRSKRDNDS